MTITQSIVPDKIYSDEVVREKLWTAESHISVVRLIVILFNSIIYFFALDDFYKVNWLGNIIIVTAFIYAVYMVVFKPYKEYPVLLSRLFSVSSDGIFITLWIIATGGADSPFYMLWCLSIIAVAQRFSFKETMSVSAIYAITYFVMIRLDSSHEVEITDLVVRLTYIPITGILGALFSREIADQIKDKVQIRDSEIQIRKIADDLHLQIEQKNKAEYELKQIQLHLEQKVNERTHDLKVLTEQLKTTLRQKEKIQRKQKKTLQNLKHTNKELESFAYITSHDLKSPLRNIATLADWLHSDYAEKFDEEGKNNLMLLKQRAKKVNELIEGVVHYSKIGEANFKANVIDTYSLVSEIAESIHADPAVSFLISENLPKVYMNKTLLTQLFHNLLSNAVTHMAKNEGKVIIDVVRKEHESVFFVMDTGPGIDKRYHQKIFEMFQTLQSDKPSDNKGLGLAIVTKIATTFGGRVWVESEPGKGSSFYFSLPASLIYTTKHKKGKAMLTL